MDIPRRVTQKDVAQQAGVTRATVSLALRGNPSIPEETRKRIADVAKRLGYAPDPMLSALATYRNQARPPGFHGSLVWLAQTAPDYCWRDVLHFTDYLEGAMERAATHGYQVEVMDITELKLSWERAATIATARGVRGLLVCPQPHADTHMDRFPWADFSAVTFGYSLTRPLLHSVTAAHYRSMMRVVRELHERGYRRIGCAVRPEHDRRLDHNFIAGYLTACTILGLTPLPVCPDDAHESDGSVLRAWLKAERPDAIITGNHHQMTTFQAWKLEIPGELGVACPTLPWRKDGQAGMLEQNKLIGQVAVDQLVAMIHRGERGVPAVPQRVLVDSIWVPGTTIRSASA